MTWQSLLPLGEDENEVIAEESHGTTFYSLDTQADETCMDLASECHWTKARQTKFLDLTTTNHRHTFMTLCMLELGKILAMEQFMWSIVWAIRWSSIDC